MAQANTAQVETNICICSGARGDFFCIECEQHFCQTCRISHKKARDSNSHHLVEALETKSKDCEICLTKYGGQFFCFDCDQYFCSNCKMIHLRANVSKNHTFTDSSELKKTHTQRSGLSFVKSWKKKTNVNETKKYMKKNEQDDEKTFEPPVNWDDQGTENVKIVSLRPSSTEYTIVEQKFLQSLFSGRQECVAMLYKRTFSVTKIERIQNLSLYHMYAAKKALIEKQNPHGIKNEQELWHGTPDKAILSINMYGFNRSYCSDNSKDAWLGDGVYFSADASYSARNWLATGTGTGYHNIYLCNVLTGMSCQGQTGMRVLPVRQDGTMLNYDSATDAKYIPVVEYVIFNDTQAYPQYCIKFKYSLT